MTKAGEKVKWRAHFNQMIARPIPAAEFPNIVQRMWDDGLVCVLSPNGYQFYSGRYPVSAKAVMEAWGLSRAQWKRFMDYCYREDPFCNIGDGEEENEEGISDDSS